MPNNNTPHNKYGTIAITPPAAKLLETEVESRKERGFSASKKGIASEAIIKAYGGKDGL